MPNDFVPNHAMTDHMGFNIAKAIENVAEALGGGSSGRSSDSPIKVVRMVAEYPGEGEDPYAGQYTDLKNDGLYGNMWLDCTYKDIFDYMTKGFAVFCTFSMSIDSMAMSIIGFLTRMTSDVPSDDGASADSIIEVQILNTNMVLYLFAKEEADYPYTRSTVRTSIPR